ncbi:MAG: hypothetical protein RR877_10025 [Aurantimicrobium sp.]|uniref:hypothetical protein n=1 Tax=Aurantimicrobium sp. TaxID=1930784 RepID=UPI002FC97A3D
MATRRSNTDYKSIKHRGVYGGREQSVTGIIKIRAGETVATTDLLQMIPLGENVRPVDIALHAVPTSGNPVLTGGGFNVGVVPWNSLPFKRPNGTEYPPIPVNASAFGNLVLPSGPLIVRTSAPSRPVATNVPNYAPYRVTLTPSATFSVAGGDIELSLTVTYVGEQIAEPYVYTDFLSQKVKN